MQVNLKKASIISQRCFEAASVITPDYTFAIDVDTSTPEKIREQAFAVANAAQAKLSDRLKLQQVAYEIRAMIGTANTAYISGALTLIESLKKQVSELSSILQRSPVMHRNSLPAGDGQELADLGARVEQMKSRRLNTELVGTVASSVTATVFNETMRQEFADKVAEYRLAIDDLNDKIVEKNHSTMVEIPDDVWDFLVKHRIVREATKASA